MITFNNGTQLKTYDSKNHSKKCSNPQCTNIYHINDFYCSCFGIDHFNNKNISDMHLSGFLPHLPYSWSRSITNLDMLVDIIDEIKKSQVLYDSNPKDMKKHLFLALLGKGKITVDSSKSKDKKYIKGGPERRVAEYLMCLQIFRLIDSNYSLTALGEYLHKTKNTSVLFLSFYILNIKNSILKGKTYQDFNVFHFKKIFEVLKEKRSLLLEDCMLILMAHQPDDYIKVHDNFFRDKSCQNPQLRKILIERYFLGENNKEMGRQKAALFNLLEASGIIDLDKTNKLYSLTKNAENLLDDIQQKQVAIDLLVKDIDSTNTNISNKAIDDLLEISNNILNKNKPIKNPLIYKSGGKHEKNMLSMFAKANIEFRKYDKSLTHINLPANVSSSLSGGTEHNPDHLCTLKGSKVLVDSKSSESIHNEIHKVIAYNAYAEQANTKTFIFLDNIIPNKTIAKIKKLLEDTPELIDRIVFFTKNAIVLLCSDNKVKESFETFYQSKGFLLVCTKNDSNYNIIAKELENNSYIVAI